MDKDHTELVEYLDEKFQAIEDRFAQLPTKSYLDDKLADLEGGIITKLRKEDDKLNRLAEMLKDKKVLSETDIAELKKLVVFPK